MSAAVACRVSAGGRLSVFPRESIESETSPGYLLEFTVATLLSGPALCSLLILRTTLLVYSFDPFNQDLQHDRKARVDRACLNKDVSPCIVPAPTRL